MALTAAEMRGAMAVAVAAFILLASIHSSNTSWNVNARMATIVALVEKGTFAIDGYDGENDDFPTMDKATFNGHFYSDKSIGVTLLGVPVYAVMHAVSLVTGVQWHLQLKIYIVRLFVASVPAALALALMWIMLLRESVPPRRAFLAIAAVFCGSWWFGYSTLTMPYAPGILSCLGAIALTLYPARGRITTKVAAAIGALCGFALLCDLTFALMVAPIVVLFLVVVFRDHRQTALELSVSGAVAGLVMLAIYVGHTYLIFGKPTIPYYYIVVPLFREGTQQGFLGIGWPQLGAAWFLTVHPYRGVFFWSPWMLLALIGCVIGLGAPGNRRLYAVMGLWAFGAYLLMNAGYYMWWGGFAMGPRIMTPMLAAVPFGLVDILRADRARAWWWSFVAASIVAMALSVPVSFINPQVEDGSYEQLRWAQIGDPIPVPQFRYVRMYYTGEFWFQDHVPRRLAMRMLPLVAFIVAGGILWRTAMRYPAATRASAL